MSTPAGSKKRLPVWLILLLVFGVVGLLIVVLAYIGFGMGSRAIERAREMKARGDLTQLILAVDLYYDDYGRLPLPLGIAATNYATQTDAAFTNILVGFDPLANPKAIRFFNGSTATGSSRVTARGGLFYHPSGHSVELFDPFQPKSGGRKNQHYFVRLDADYDNVIEGPHGRKIKDLRAIAWSVGPDGLFHPDPNHEDNRDNIYSWPRP